ncbi:MAG: hypothetical protein LBE12_16510 [Planctomycetaceae bacterium]|nr:hypothetical protein [Planctomycetaceae bacterium]
MKRICNVLFFVLVIFSVLSVLSISAVWSEAAERIDREKLVKRHTITLGKISDSELLQVGNGEIAYGIDSTGLQTFFGNTMSQWGWHSVPCPVEGSYSALKLEKFDFHGRELPYRTSAAGQEKLFTWMRENPHRINLGRLRFLIKKNNGNLIEPKDVQKIKQTLNLWEGTIDSSYEIEGEPVRVQTCVEPTTGSLAVKIQTDLIKQERLQIEWTFPYGSPGKSGADWAKPENHKTTIQQQTRYLVTFKRQLDNDIYYAAAAWKPDTILSETAPHTFVLTPDKSKPIFEFSAGYSPQEKSLEVALFDIALRSSQSYWQHFWKTGGAIDLSESSDPRWKELERRIVLSQYLLAVNESGSLPPQESGLFNNSGWYGKFHLEMHWWHGAHFGLWNRWESFDKSLKWYRDILPKAKELAVSQGFTGARFPKMIGPNAEDAPSGIGPLLIWQQPHPIFYAEMEYRLFPTKETLEKWREVVQESAVFMADFAFFDEKTNRYILGPPLKTVPENNNAKTTLNPSYELSYWRSGLRMAQTWRERLGLPREKRWDEIIQKLAELPQHDGVYLLQENLFDTYTKWNWEHPSLIGMSGMLPSDGTDSVIMKRTVNKVWTTWQWDRCWGWDFPMMAMSAAKNGESKIAVDALLHPSYKNAMNKVGLSMGGPFPYFPSNGGLLYAVAMMAAGWDGSPKIHAPGFPNDGSWKVRFENLKPAL